MDIGIFLRKTLLAGIRDTYENNLTRLMLVGIFMKIIFHAAFRDTSNLMDNFTSRLISILHTENNFTR